MIRTLARRTIFAALTAAVVLALLWQVRWRAVSVEGFEVQPRELTVETMGTGTLEPRVSSTVSAKIQGRIVELTVDQGDAVEEGQVLVRLDDLDLTRQIDVAAAVVEVNRAALNRIESDRQRAEAVLAQARLEHQQVIDTFARGASSPSERDRVIERLAIAQAELARAQAAIVEARAALAASERSLDLQRAQLDDTVIRSPLSGLVVRRDREVGDIVVPGSSIFRLIETGTLWVSAWVDETAMAALHVDQPARIVFRSEPDREYRGHVARLGREVDPELREFIVEVVVDELPAAWAVGQRAEVYVTTDRAAQALAIPAEYLFAREGADGVWVNESGRAQWRPCEVGLRGRAFIELTRGLEAGDVVLRPADDAAERMLRAGRKVALR